MITINRDEIAGMEKRYRTTFINSLPGYKCLQMVGTANRDGITNLGLFNSVFHVGANPALLGMVVRPDTPDHDTLDNIKETGDYTFNNVLPDWYLQAHQTSANFPSGISEFLPCGFTKYYLENFKAPFVLQSSVKIGLELREVIDLSINNTQLVIGEVVLVITENEFICGDGYLDPIKAGSVTVSGLDSYFTAKSLGRVAYARPHEQPQKLKVY